MSLPSVTTAGVDHHCIHKDCQRMRQPNVGTWTLGGCSESSGNPILLMDKMQDWFLSFNRVWSFCSVILM